MRKTLCLPDLCHAACYPPGSDMLGLGMAWPCRKTGRVCAKAGSYARGSFSLLQVCAVPNSYRGSLRYAFRVGCHCQDCQYGMLGIGMAVTCDSELRQVQLTSTLCGPDIITVSCIDLTSVRRGRAGRSWACTTGLRPPPGPLPTVSFSSWCALSLLGLVTNCQYATKDGEG